MKKVNVRLDNRIRISKDSLTPEVIETLENRLTFKNPLFYANERYGRPNYGITPTLSCIWHDGETGDLVIARGFQNELIRIFHANRLEFEIQDLTRQLPEVDFDFHGAPFSYQYGTWHELEKHRFAILCSPIGAGKKITALNLIAKRKVPALVVVTTKRRLAQWRMVVDKFLNLQIGDLGLIGSGHRDLGRKLTLSITLSLYKVLDEIEPHIGFVIVDQCDRANLKILFKTAMFQGPYTLGLADNTKRHGGLTALMMAHLGPRVEMWPGDSWDSFGGLGERRPRLKIRPTTFNYEYKDDWSDMIGALCRDEERNKLIVQDILESTAESTARALVVSGRVGHLEALAELLKGAYSEGEIITGETPEKMRESIIRRFDMGKLQVILLTFKNIPHVEVKKANRLFVASPLNFDGQLIQVIGRLLGSEHPVIYDYRDRPELLINSLNRRLKVYRQMGAK